MSAAVAAVEGGEEKTVESSDELTTRSTVAPRLNNNSPPSTGIKTPASTQPSLRDEDAGKDVIKSALNFLVAACF
jgi:hypothetical protein